MGRVILAGFLPSIVVRLAIFFITNYLTMGRDVDVLAIRVSGLKKAVEEGKISFLITCLPKSSTTTTFPVLLPVRFLPLFPLQQAALKVPPSIVEVVDQSHQF